MRNISTQHNLNSSAIIRVNYPDTVSKCDLLFDLARTAENKQPVACRNHKYKPSVNDDGVLISNKTVCGILDFFTNSTSGFTTKFDEFFKSTLGTDTVGGSMDRMMTAMTTANTNIDKQIADIERRLEAEREKLESAYQAMENAQLKANNILTQLSKSFYSS